MAHKKAGGSSRNGRDSAGRRLGVKKYGGEVCHSRQHHHASARHQDVAGRRRWHGQRPHDLCTTEGGTVKFHKGLKGRTFISVLPVAEAAE